MSWLDDVVSFGSNLIGSVVNSNIGSTLLKTAITGLALSQVTKSVTKSNDASKYKTSSFSTSTGTTIGGTTAPPVDQGVRVQTSADTNTKIPVLYGTAVMGGTLVDARMSNDNQNMFYVYALSEVTGNLLSTGSASTISFNQIFWDDQTITFESDGQTIQKTTDRNGKEDVSLAGLVKIYCYRNGSTVGALPQGYTGSVPNAYSIVPGWDTDWEMSNLAFAIVKVTYNKEKGVTGIGNVTFQLTNTLTLPGDVLFDMMTNTRYGAGIDSADIKTA
jgi:hypothetical protein